MIKAYLKDIEGIEYVSKENNKALNKAIRDNKGTEKETRAREKLVLGCGRLMVKLARAYAGDNTDVSDLIQEANVMLTRLAERYDPDRGVGFTTYIDKHIRGILRAESSKERTHRKRNKTILDAPSKEDECLLINLIETPDTETPYVIVERRDLADTVHKIVKSFKGMDCEIMERRLGLNGYQPHSLKEVGKAVGLSFPTVWQREIAAMRKVREIMEHNMR
ncbi:sigma-70 family RNA polymerase sigma factor [Candidatus Woesearchaeota archaeon]|nr:sigma-70 family RNA polymerase sigma factor [Candidatus Woesearchaeota archaeon]